MTDRRRQRAWNALGWVGIGIAVVLAAAGFVALLVTWPLVAGVLLVLACTHGAAWWLPNRALREELEAARRQHTMHSDRGTRTALHEQGPVTELGAGVRYLEGAMYNAAGVSDPTPDEVAEVHSWATRMAGWLARANVRIVGPGRRPPQRPYDHALPAGPPPVRAEPSVMWDPRHGRRID